MQKNPKEIIPPVVPEPATVYDPAYEFEADYHPGDYSKLEMNLGYIGDAVRRRAPTAGEQVLRKTVTRTRLLPNTKKANLPRSKGEKAFITPRQAVRQLAQKDTKGIMENLANTLFKIDDFFRNEMANIQTEAMKAYSSGAITQAEAKQIISKRGAELSQKRRVDTNKAKLQAKQAVKMAVKDARKKVASVVRQKQAVKTDARIRQLEQRKARVSALASQGEIDSNTATIMLGDIDALISENLHEKGVASPNPKVEMLTRKIFDLRKKIQALSSAIAQADGVGANFVTFGDIQVDLEEARNRRLVHERQIVEAEAEIARLRPMKPVPARYSPINQDGRPIMLEEIKAELKFALANGNIDRARKLQTIINGFDPSSGLPVTVTIHTVALREMVPAGEKIVVTQTGTGKTKIAPLPNSMPSAVPYATYKQEE
jgi:hypothetical protein